MEPTVTGIIFQTEFRSPFTDEQACNLVVQEVNRLYGEWLNAQWRDWRVPLEAMNVKRVMEGGRPLSDIERFFVHRLAMRYAGYNSSQISHRTHYRDLTKEH
jgi:hypothetical protein